MSERAAARRGEKATMTHTARRTRTDRRWPRRLPRLGVAVLMVGGVLQLVPGPSSAALPLGAPKVGMVCTPGTVAGSTHTFNLVAKTGYIDTPDGNSVFMWSYANADAPDNGHFQSPARCSASPRARPWSST